MENNKDNFKVGDRVKFTVNEPKQGFVIGYGVLTFVGSKGGLRISPDKLYRGTIDYGTIEKVTK